MFSSIGGGEILVILVVGLLIIGPDKLPGVMRAAGKILGDIRRVSTDFQRTVNTELAKDETRRNVSASPQASPHSVLPAAPSPDDRSLPLHGAPSGHRAQRKIRATSPRLKKRNTQ